MVARGSVCGRYIDGGRERDNPRRVCRETFWVRQKPGAALGYDILPYDPSAGTGAPTFEGFKWVPQGGATTLSAPGVAGSNREIRTLNTTTGTAADLACFDPARRGGGICFLETLEDEMTRHQTGAYHDRAA